MLVHLPISPRRWGCRRLMPPSRRYALPTAEPTRELAPQSHGGACPRPPAATAQGFGAVDPRVLERIVDDRKYTRTGCVNSMLMSSFRSKANSTTNSSKTRISFSVWVTGRNVGSGRSCGRAPWATLSASRSDCDLHGNGIPHPFIRYKRQVV